MNTELDIRSLAIELLQGPGLDLRLSAALGHVIAADAEFNLWVAGKAKGSSSEARMLQLLEVADDCLAIMSSVRLYEGATQADRAKALSQIQSVVNSLRSATGRES